METFIKWFSIVWSVLAIAIVAISNWMYTNDIETIFGLEPFNVKNNIAVALLLAPGGIAALVHFFIYKGKS